MPWLVIAALCGASGCYDFEALRALQDEALDSGDAPGPDSDADRLARPDLAGIVDLAGMAAMADMPDLAGSADRVVGLDPGVVSDLAPPSDRGVADLSSPRDLAALPDLARPADLATRDLSFLCGPGRADCNGDPADQCEVTLASNPGHCGACGNACAVEHGAASCVNAACVVRVCDAGWADCNADPADGCEANVAVDPARCGSCGRACVYANASPVCTAGVCRMGACKAGWDDCDGAEGNGCEANLRSDVKHCSGCGGACPQPLNSPLAACNNGVCGITCPSGLADCNGALLDGCEIATASDPRNCGACGAVCSQNHLAAAPTCALGQCGGACASGWVDCNGDRLSDGCEASLSTDPANCGACGGACSRNHITVPTCGMGRCNGACDPGWADCNGDKLGDGCETPISTSVAHCGACGRACSASNVIAPICAGGTCVGQCTAGYTDCNGDKQRDGCEAPLGTDVKNCGGCGLACSAANMQTVTCFGGACVGACAAGYADCNGDKQRDGCESQLAADPKNCGACRVACSTANVIAATCSQGVCASACSAGFLDCDRDLMKNGCEIDAQRDAGNCGACGAACSGNQVPATTCVGGMCAGACAAGWADCNGSKLVDGCELQIQGSDVNNCGGCRVTCSATQVVAATCAAGACTSPCAPPFLDCNRNLQVDGCEVDPRVDPRNCGGCGMACSSNNVIAAVCAGGACTSACKAGYSDCNLDRRGDGCEVTTTSDARNCGACGAACSLNNVTPLCTAGACVGTCAPNYADCNGDKLTDGCERDLRTDAGNCGACGRPCSANNVVAPTCAASACVSACAAPFLDCNGNKQSDGCEVDSRVNAAHCGACGKACSASNVITPECTASVCSSACKPGYADCNANKQSDGCEVGTATDTRNCGACGASCSNANIAKACVAGSCGAGVCRAGWVDCNGNKQSDGCEVAPATDVANCGACGVVCATNHITRACVGGSCNAGVCGAGYADCNGNKQADGCEAELAIDPSNCGACNKPCALPNVSAPTCALGTCGGACDAGYGDCDNDKVLNGCEAPLTSDPKNCGACAVDCSTTTNPACINGACTCLTAMDCAAGVTDQCAAGQCRCGAQNPCDPVTQQCVGGACRGVPGAPCGVDGDCVSSACGLGICK